MSNYRFQRGARHIAFRYDIIRGLIKTGEADVLSCYIKYNSENTIKRTASISLAEKNSIDFLRDKIRAVMLIDGAEKALGTFILSTPKLDENGASGSYTAEAYDTTNILKEDCFTERAFFAAGSRYDDIIGSIILSAGVTDYYLPTIDVRLSVDREFELGRNKLDVIGELLDEVNFNPLIADENGRLTTSKYVQPGVSSVSKEYYDDEVSVISPKYESETDYYNVPNVFVARCDNPELKQEYYSVYVNDNPSSRLSTISRGRRIVSPIYQPDYIESQEALDEYIRRKAAEESAVFDKLKIKTALMPDHGYKDVIRIRNGDISGIYLEKSWEMELKAGAMMTHNLVGVYEV